MLAVRNILTKLREDLYRDRIEKLVTWYNKCPDRHGDYIEKYFIL